MGFGFYVPNRVFEQKRTGLVGSWTTVQDNIAGIADTLQITDAGAATQPQRFTTCVLLP